MANVGFKLGLQENLDALLKNKTGIVAGSFYLTSDTNRLYFGQSETSLVPVNEGVITVASVSDLNSITAHAGSFYYASNDNVLCVYNGQTWVQINAVVTNDSLTQAVTTTDGVAQVATSLSDSRGGEPLKATFSVKGANGVTITSEGTVLTVSGDPIELAVTGDAGNNLATAAITSTGGVNEQFQIAGGDNVTVTADNNNKITIAATDRYLTDVNIASKAQGFGLTGEYNDGEAFNGSIDINPLITIKANADSTAADVGFVNGKATLPVYTAGQVDGLIEGVETKLADELKAFNAMEYRGLVGDGTTQTALPTSEVKNGYAYLVSGNLVHNGTTYTSGALVVASGTEGDDGYIPTADITWTFISGSTIDTTYSGSINATTGALSIIPSTGDSTPVASINVVDVDDNGVVVETSATSGNTQTYTVKHASYGEAPSYGDVTTSAPAAMEALTPATDPYEITAITGVSVTNGHVTGVTTKTFKVLDTNITIDSLNSNVAVATANGKTTATVSHGIAYTDGTGAQHTDATNSSFTVASSSLAVAQDGTNGIAVDLVWGTF